jgi:uncharacterized protein
MNLALDATHLGLAAFLFVGAALYSSVGHAGASAYIAAMALFGVPAAVMRPTALVLNILVASLGSWRYARAGHFRWRTLWPTLIGSIPMALAGGAVQLPSQYYRPLVGLVLLFSAARLLWPKPITASAEVCDPPVAVGIAVGALIGLLAGLTGTGGGIFLSPILIFLGWSSVRDAIGIAAAFILCNSIAGLLGNVASVRAIPPELPVYAGAVLAGGLLGTTAGLTLPVGLILKALGVVLLIAGGKLILTP